MDRIFFRITSLRYPYQIDRPTDRPRDNLLRPQHPNKRWRHGIIPPTNAPKHLSCYSACLQSFCVCWWTGVVKEQGETPFLEICIQFQSKFEWLVYLMNIFWLDHKQLFLIGNVFNRGILKSQMYNVQQFFGRLD